MPFLLWRSYQSALLHSIIVSLLLAPTFAIWPFPTKKFNGNSLIGAGTLGVRGERVIAFGDFNGDQFLDILTLESDQKTLTVNLWSHENFEFTSSSTFAHPTTVVNVVPGDFTHTGKLDILVMSEGRSRGTLDLFLYKSLSQGGFDVENPISLQSSTLVQPMTLDLNGDMKIDLFGHTPTASNFQAWENVWNESDPNSVLFKVIDPSFHGQQCTIANPHSNAVIDLNGDCLADIFLLCDDGRGGKNYQIWINGKENGFSLATQGSLPSGVQTVSFADLDRDGTTDLLFVTCSSVSDSTGVGNDCALNMAFNQQLPLCAYATDSGYNKKGERICRPPDNLCTSDPGFKFDFTLSESNYAFIRIPVSELFPSPAPSLLVKDTTANPPIPIPIKIGDGNQDGFPDFLLIVANGQGHTPKMLLSVPCSKGMPGCNKDGYGRRSWKVVTKDTDALDAIKDARGLAFLDMDEDGTLDIMVQRTGSDGAGKILFLQNNIYYDAFFLKAIVLNGACNNGWCYGPNGTGRYHPFGVSYSGASYKYTVLDTSGRRSAAQVGQLPQTGYHALQTPYSFFGIGRTNNYIENLFVGSTLHRTEHYINMEGVIPNSKVVILPSAEKGVAWKRELFLRPGAWIPWVTVTAVAGTIVLGIIVFVLHLNEKREDQLERRRASHHINFDAL